MVYVLVFNSESENNTKLVSVGSTGVGDDEKRRELNGQMYERKKSERNKKLDDVMVREQVERIDFFIFINLLKHY